MPRAENISCFIVLREKVHILRIGGTEEFQNAVLGGGGGWGNALQLQSYVIILLFSSN